MKSRWLRIPAEPEWCYIPLGISEPDFDMLMQTIQVWKSRIIRGGDQDAESQSQLPQDEPKSLVTESVMGNPITALI